MKALIRSFAFVALVVCSEASWSQQVPSQVSEDAHAAAAFSKEIRDLLSAQTAAIKSLANRVVALESRIQVLESKKQAHHD